MSNPKLSLEDIVDNIMLAESKPTYAALLRWCERYPQYQDALADFFATWAVQSELAAGEAPPAFGADRLVTKGVEYAMEIARRQGRIRPKSMTALRPFDQLVLTAI